MGLWVLPIWDRLKIVVNASSPIGGDYLIKNKHARDKAKSTMPLSPCSLRLKLKSTFKTNLQEMVIENVILYKRIFFSLSHSE